LDNCEHLAAACADLSAALLSATPKLNILATSRTPLNVAGEFLYSVPPLSVPASDRDLPLAALMQSEAVLLFLARAQAAKPSFRLTNENAAGVLQVCQHLDGIPLALELAAARVRLLSPEQIAARLGDRFSLLTGGDRSPLPHHQTLRGALDWSYDLLTGPERQLLRRLAVFAGSFSLDAVEEICAERSEDGQAEQALHRSQVRESHVLDLLAALVDHSLIILEERETENRYRLLETVRQYARDKLRASGEQATFQDRHLEFYVALAQEGAPHIDAGRPAWTARFESDYDNFREAMAVALDGHPASALLLGVSLAGFARFSRRLYEADGWATRILALTTAEPGANTPASALWLAGDLRLWMGDYSQAEGLLNSSLNRARWLGDKQQMGRTLNDLGQMHLQRGQRVELARCVGEYNTFAEELGNPVWTIDALRALGIFDIDEGDENAGQARFEEALALARKHDLPRLKAEVLWAIGQLAHLRGDLGRAEQLYGESALTLRRIGYLRSLRSVVADLGKLELERGHDVEARTLFEENSALTLELRDLPEYNVVLLMGLAGTAGLAGQDERAARLFAAADSVLKRRDWDLNAVSHRVYDPIIAAVHARLGNEAFDAAWTEGSRMTVDQALEYARAEAPAGRQP
jgi:predicted ATPase